MLSIGEGTPSLVTTIDFELKYPKKLEATRVTSMGAPEFMTDDATVTE